jgi:two-component system phosphate regulon sensor histidine kinase PhoR
VRTGSSYRPLNAVEAKRRLALWLFACGLLLAFPIGVLLLRTYQQFRNEAFYQYQTAAIELVNRLNERVYEMLKPEAERPFDHYSFWSVPQNALVPEETLNVSPLAQLALKTTVPGVIGYFQIDPDGSFHSPVLPELNLNGVSGRQDTPLSHDEVNRRVALKAKLQALLNQGGASLAEEPEAEPALRDAQASDRASTPQESAKAPGPGKPQPKKTADLKLDEDLYRRQEALPKRPGYAQGRDARLEKKALPQAPRTETSSYLEPSAGLLSESGNEAMKLRSNQNRASIKEERQAMAREAQAPAPRFGAKIERFEGEIYPIEFEILPNGDFSFYRKVWRDRQRYVQGFVVNGDEVLREVFEGIYQGSVLRDQATLILSYRGEVLRSYGAAREAARILVFRSPLAFPLGDIELIVSATELTLGTGAYLVNALAVFLSLLIPGVLYGVYRLGGGQIELAQERSNFVSAVSHELKTPLTSIRMYGEILRAGWVESEDKKRSYYDFIFFESERLSRLIANVLHLARLTNNDSPLELRSYPPDRLLDIIRSKVSSQIEAAGFALELAAAELPASLTILAEEDAFSRIFINLVDNALKFSRTAEQKAVVIGYRLANGGGSEEGEVVFFVRDYGPGIDRDQRKKLFRLFYRGENELTRTTPGTGIGLALVKELAAKMNAQVDLESKEPGVEFTVRFRC